uniref:Ovule protein n=1 Tax=Meloidogyne incognita TaxID=6306 RepID=A0A914MAC3_MELIC
MWREDFKHITCTNSRKSFIKISMTEHLMCKVESDACCSLALGLHNRHCICKTNRKLQPSEINSICLMVFIIAPHT